MDKRYTTIRRIIGESYERMYGPVMCNLMAQRVWEKWATYGVEPTGNRDELMNYLWMNTSGGGVAEYTANRLRKEVQ